MENSSHSSAPTTNVPADTSSTNTACTINTDINITASSGTTASAGPVQNSLRGLNKNSHKISKHVTKQQHPSTSSTNPNPDPAPPETTVLPTSLPAPTQPQPPVYNINKNDFRDVVQKLTGSPAHLSAPQTSVPPASSPTPPAPIRPTSTTGVANSRLHKIRPPPLSHLAPRPATTEAAGDCLGNAWMRPSMTTLNSPLPAFPTVSAAAESPITAYMRRLHSGGVGGPQHQQGPMIPSSPVSVGAPLFPLPTSPLGFGCIPSPRSAYQTLRPPSSSLPMPSPKGKEQ